MTTRIFLSHTQGETPFVRAVAEALSARGVDTGTDRGSIEAGTDWEENLSQGLASSSAVVVFLGDSTNSAWMNFEIGAAVGTSKPVVPVFLTHAARESAPGVVARLQGIEAQNLKPDEVAEKIANAVNPATASAAS